MGRIGVSGQTSRGAQSLPGADFDEIVGLVKDTGLPLILAGDNDQPGLLAMRKVRDLLKDRHIDSVDTARCGTAEGSIADLPTEDLQALLRLLLADHKQQWLKPVRNSAKYERFKCPRPKRRKRNAEDGQGIRSLIPCGNTGVCQQCANWEAFLHVERCWMGKPAQMVVVSGFGGQNETISETTGLGKIYRGHFEGRLRKNSYVRPYSQEKHTGERRNFISTLAIGEDYRAALTLFFSAKLSDEQLAKERRRAERAGLVFHVKDYPTRADIEDAAPKSLSIAMEGIGATDKTNTWTSSGWPAWWEPETTYAFSDGRELADGEDFPLDAIEAKEWKRENGQKWDCKKTLADNLIQREGYAWENAQRWMTNCYNLNLETLQAIGAGGDIEALILEIGDYQGPTALLRDTAAYMATGQGWRKAFRPVLDVAGWRA